MTFDPSWSNLAKVVYLRTYSRRDSGRSETFPETVERMIRGNTKHHDVSEHEKERLRHFLLNRKAGPAGRGWWFSGTEAHDRLGGAALCNCWAFTMDSWTKYVRAQDLLMLGGGVGMSVEHRFVSKLPRVKKDVVIVHKHSKDADFIVPDSREGWNELTHRVLEAFFVTGRSFSYSTICIRGEGEAIRGFGGISAGPRPLIAFVEVLTSILTARAGKAMRPIDAADILCAIGDMVVSGNVRRSALVILGDPWDKEYLKAKRWDLGVLPGYRARANWSVVCDDVDDLHPLFWKTYEHGEAFGLFNRTNVQKFGRMGELKADSAVVSNPCLEATLESDESCNLQSIAMPNLASEEEFIEAARLMHRWGKRVTCEKFHLPASDEVIKRNRRIGTSITGVLASSLFTPQTLDRVYAAIQDENAIYSRELGINESIRTTTVNPSGTIGKAWDMQGYEGGHAAFSRYIIQRVRFAYNDPMISALREAGHHMEPEIRLDGTLDHNTLVVDFYVKAPDGFPVADEDWDTWKQLEVVKTLQRHWADQSVSVTVYYKKEEIPQLKAWLQENLQYLKAISFLCHSDHGYKQAPKEKISQAQYERGVKQLTDLNIDDVSDSGLLSGLECEGGACPVR